MRRCPDVDSTSGRGVLLLEALGTAWGTEHDVEAGGKSAWVELAAQTER